MAKKRVQIEIEAKTKKAQKEVEDLKDEINDTTDAAEDLGKKGEDSGEQISKGMDSSTTSVAGLLTKLGLAAGAFKILQGAIRSNQTLQNAWNTATNTGSVLITKLGRGIEGFFEEANKRSISDVFSDGVDSVTNWGSKVFNTFSNVKKIFTGTREEQEQAAVEIAKNAIEFEQKTGLGASVKSAKDLTDQTNKVIIAQAENRKLLEQYDEQAELQRQIRDDVSKSMEERIEANNQLGIILNSQEKTMKANAQLEVDLAKTRIEVLGDTVENQAALIDAEAEVIAIRATVAGFRSEQLVNENSLLDEQLAKQKESADAEAAKAKADEDKRKKAEEQKIKDDEEAAAAREKQTAIEEKAAQEFIDRKERMRLASIDGIQQVLQATISAAGAESKVGQALFLLKQGLMIREQIMNAKANIQNAISKGTEASVDAQAGMVKATSSAPPPANIPIMAIYAGQILPVMASVIAAVAQAKQMASKAGAGGFGGGASLSAPQAPAAAAPNFNIVGAAAENQLAQTISQQTQTPVKAFVVSNDVTTAQSMDRNIIESSSI